MDKLIIIGSILAICYVTICIILYLKREKIEKQVEEKELELEKAQELINKIRQEQNEFLNQKDEVQRDLTQLKIDKEEAYKDLQATVSQVESNKNLMSYQKDEIEKTQKMLDDNTESIKNSILSFEKLTSEAKEKYFEELEADYDRINKSYDNRKIALQKELTELENSIKAKVEARKREQQIDDDKDNFRLNLTDRELRDIKLLNSIKDELSSPAAVNKIIWSNYYQPMAKTKFPKIIGKSTTCGIYKITNTVTGEAYVGQSNDLYKRWCEHCKDGLGAGTKAASAQAKLYGNVRQYGLSNFTFEVLEECSAADLNKKEREYISLYDTYAQGLNATAGNK